MISYKKIGLLLCVFVFQIMSAQDSLVLPFRLKFGNELLQLHRAYISKNNDTLQISLLKFYISSMEVQYNDASVFTSKKYQLVDFENPQSLKMTLSQLYDKPISKITFCIGIDSLASVSGALPGDLDPVNGMYWAWQSGYINMKIEGQSPSCKTRKNEFQFHIGGYLKPNYAMRKVCLDVKTSKPEIIVDLAGLFSKIQLADTNSIMIPGINAMKIADNCVNMFRIE